MFTPLVERWRPMVRAVLSELRDEISPEICASLILALIDCESSGDPEAEGSVEIGLMQVVHREGATRLGWGAPETRPPRERLLDPAFNIATGVLIFNRYLQRLNGDYWRTFLAYKTGVGGVDDAPDSVIARRKRYCGYAWGDAGSDFWAFAERGITKRKPEGGEYSENGCTIEALVTSPDASSPETYDLVKRIETLPAWVWPVAALVILLLLLLLWIYLSEE